MASGAYTGEKWESARRACLARDGRRCQDCGSGDGLHVHHIKPVRTFDNAIDAHYVDNLVTLCKSCHRKWEGKNARPVLLSERSGLALRDVVTDIVTDMLYRETMDADPVANALNLLEYDPHVCSNCYGRCDSSSFGRRFQWRVMLEQLSFGRRASGRFKDLLGVTNSGAVCSECSHTVADGGATPGPQSSRERREAIVNVAERCWENDIEFNIAAARAVLDAAAGRDGLQGRPADLFETAMDFGLSKA